MGNSTKTTAEQQLGQRLKQLAALHAANQPALAWSVVAPRPWWRWSLLPVATAAAIGWFVVTEQPLWPSPPATNERIIPPMLMAENYHLEALDQHIQNAYLHGADEQTIQQLWQQRHYWTEQHRVNQEWNQ